MKKSIYTIYCTLLDYELKPFEKIYYNSIKNRNDDACAVLDDWQLKGDIYAIDVRYLQEKNMN